MNVDLRKLWLFLIAQWFFVSDMLIAKFFQHATNLRMSCNYHIVSLMPFWMTNNELAICLMPRSITKKRIELVTRKTFKFLEIATIQNNTKHTFDY